MLAVPFQSPVGMKRMRVLASAASNREDDAEGLMDAISRLKGVISVSGNVSDITAWLSEERARKDLGDKIWNVIYPTRN